MKSSSNYMTQFRLPIGVYERLLSEAQKAGVNRSEYLAKLLTDLFGNKISDLPPPGFPMGQGG